MERTTYNEKGEEVTEMVYEDGEPEAESMLIDEKVSAHLFGQETWLIASDQRCLLGLCEQVTEY